MNATGQNGSMEMVISSDPRETRQVQEEVERALRRYQFEERDIFSVRLALEEALINAIKHGNQLDRNKKVHVAWSVENGQLQIQIRDEGPGFDPNEVPDPLDPENLERPCGRGLLLMRHYMTEVMFDPPGNSLRMTKLRSTPSPNGHVSP